MSERKAVSQSRRRFLAGVVVGGGAAAGVAVAGVAPRPDADAASGDADRSASTETRGYRETAHIRRYYDLARG